MQEGEGAMPSGRFAIHAEMLAASHPTELEDSCFLVGKSPRLSKRQMVVRDKLVMALTSGNLKNRFITCSISSVLRLRGTLHRDSN